MCRTGQLFLDVASHFVQSRIDRIGRPVAIDHKGLQDERLTPDDTFIGELVLIAGLLGDDHHAVGVDIAFQMDAFGPDGG